MKKFILAVALFVVPSMALGGNDYSCGLPEPQRPDPRPPQPSHGPVSDQPEVENSRSGLGVAYLVYNGTGTERVESETLDVYQKLVDGHPAFFEVLRPSITLFDKLSQVAAANDSLEPELWRAVIVIGNKDGARWLHEEGVSAIAFVPSEYAIGSNAIHEVETTAKTTYYAIAIDHALRRGTRMAAGVEPPSLSSVTVEHIVTDARIANN